MAKDLVVKFKIPTFVIAKSRFLRENRNIYF